MYLYIPNYWTNFIPKLYYFIIFACKISYEINCWLYDDLKHGFIHELQNSPNSIVWRTMYLPYSCVRAPVARGDTQFLRTGINGHFHEINCQERATLLGVPVINEPSWLSLDCLSYSLINNTTRVMLMTTPTTQCLNIHVCYIYICYIILICFGICYMCYKRLQFVALKLFR